VVHLIKDESFLSFFTAEKSEVQNLKLKNEFRFDGVISKFSSQFFGSNPATNCKKSLKSS
jgi:hypothetical protein